MPRYTARWVIPVDRPPLARGVVEIEGDRIVAVEPPDELAPQEPAIDLGEVAVLPGLVNAHTHLEFSDLAEPVVAGPSFADWIGRVVEQRRGQSDPVQAVQRGWNESLQSGVTTLGEIATSDAWSSIAPGQAPGVVFRELIGLKSDRWEPALDTARQHLQQTPEGNANWIRGLSPHAPYSVHPRLYERLIDLAVEAGAPVAVHLAETREELELLQHGRGPLVEQLKKFGAWEEGLIPRGTRVLDSLMPLADVDHGLVIHGNYLTDEEIDFVARHRNLSVVYCPRTHAAFGHPPHPWRKLLDAGVRIALGTDSRASNPDLSLWNEVLWLSRKFREVDSSLFIRMATLRGAQALGCDADVGSLTPGKLANLIVLRPDASVQTPRAAEDFALSTDSIAGVMQSGQWIRLKT
jgi:cytosine/adenosine deaminase-related metal-dependent hydrolase